MLHHLFQFMRVFGQLLVGNVFGQLIQMGIPGPEDLNGLDLLLLGDLIAPFFTALGKKIQYLQSSSGISDALRFLCSKMIEICGS